MRFAVVLVALGLLIPAAATGAEVHCGGHAPETYSCTRSFVIEGDGGVGMSVYLAGDILQGFQGALRADVKSPTASQSVTCVAGGPGPGFLYCRFQWTGGDGFPPGETATLTVTVAGEGEWRVYAEG